MNCEHIVTECRLNCWARREKVVSQAVKEHILIVPKHITDAKHRLDVRDPMMRIYLLAQAHDEHIHNLRLHEHHG